MGTCRYLIVEEVQGIFFALHDDSRPPFLVLALHGHPRHPRTFGGDEIDSGVWILTMAHSPIEKMNGCREGGGLSSVDRNAPAVDCATIY